MHPARLPASGLQCAGPSQAACTALEMQAAGVTISVPLRFLMYSTVGAAASLIGRDSQAWARRGEKDLAAHCNSNFLGPTHRRRASEIAHMRWHGKRTRL